jgi:Protein of unknown function (DUF2891)
VPARQAEGDPVAERLAPFLAKPVGRLAHAYTLTALLTLPRKDAETYAATALANVRREFPAYVVYIAEEPTAQPSSRELHPAFYGSLDWHSCVEMHWVLARLLRLELVADPEIRRGLDENLSSDALAVEADFFAAPQHSFIERPYGWGWLLRLAHELAEWQDDDARRWSANLEPLAQVLAGRLVDWLPKSDYPVRTGVHPNSAFSLSLALPYARKASAGLEAAIVEAALRWFHDDVDYPAAWEPSGSDFLSPALTEAELMLSILQPADFVDWLDRFLPELPAALLEPVAVSDPTDGHIAHLHGLNLSRAWCMLRIADVLPENDARVSILHAAAERHAEASLPFVTGVDYMLDHWLPAYAVLLLT